jgi:hypothetical protein
MATAVESEWAFQEAGDDPGEFTATDHDMEREGWSPHALEQTRRNIGAEDANAIHPVKGKIVTTKRRAHRGAPSANGDLPEITQEQLAAFQRKQLEAQRLRVETCAQEIAEVCRKYNCDLAGVPQLKDAGGVFVIAVGVQVVAKRE